MNTLKGKKSIRPHIHLKMTIASLSFVFISPLTVKPQGMPTPDLTSVNSSYFSAPKMTTAFLFSNIATDESDHRQNQCLKTSRWIGAIAGSTMGLMQIYWSATGMSGIHGPFWKNILTGVPSAIIGSYVGTRSTEWITKQIMKGSPKPGKAMLKGAAYGALNGAIILTASMVPLLLIGHYSSTIHFNVSKDLIFLKLIGAAVIGGTLYGGTIGAGFGIVYGPCVSLYMKF